MGCGEGERGGKWRFLVWLETGRIYPKRRIGFFSGGEADFWGENRLI